VQRVLSVGKSDVARLIEKAVNRTLMERTIGGLSDEEKRFVMDAAREAFDDNVQEMHELEVSKRTVERDKQDIREELERLKKELAPKPGFDETRKQEAAGEELKRLRLRIQARLLPIFDRLPQGAGVPSLRETAVDLLALFVQERDAALARQREEMGDSVVQLERRIAKLMHSLEVTEEVLSRVSSAKDLDFGIESIYRTVQGLNPGESQHDRKLEMMKNIFEANLILQRQ
jgi:hypothetical protein